jgi:O-antigen/teichoic acid export membrane protein
VLLLPALVTALVWGLAVREAHTAAEIYAAVCLCLALFSGIIIARRLPAPVWRATAEFRTREWSLAALAILMGSASTELIARTSVIVLGALESEREVGLYNAAARLAIMNVFFLRVLTPVAAPRFSVLYSAGQFAALRSMFRQLCLMSLAGGLPCFLLLILFPELVLGWFGHEFVESEATLRVLSVGYLASAATGPCATALMMIGRERAYACLTFGALLASAAANYVLAQHMGALGAAIATAGIMVLNNALYVIVFMRATAPSNARPPS